MVGRKTIQYRWRRIAAVVAAGAAAIGLVIASPDSYEEVFEPKNSDVNAQSYVDSGVVDSGSTGRILATDVLAKLEVKGRAPKTGYSREEFYNNWPTIDGCSLRQRIIKREVGESAKLGTDNCTVLAGEFTEPYTGQYLIFTEKSQFTKGIQIDHVVALSDAWQKGAQSLSKDERYALATDPLNLIAADASANQQKSDGDAATWLPKNKGFRCEYVARQVSVKYKYNLWVTQAEKDAIDRVLSVCPSQEAIGLEELL